MGGQGQKKMSHGPEQRQHEIEWWALGEHRKYLGRRGHEQLKTGVNKFTLFQREHAILIFKSVFLFRGSAGISLYDVQFKKAAL